MVYGSEEVLTPLIKASLEVTNVKFYKDACSVTFVNNTNIPIVLRKGPGCEQLQYRRFLIVYPHEQVTYWIKSSEYYNAPLKLNEFDMSFEVENFHTAPNTPLLYTIHLTRPQ
jgi:hypothetical protein